jgi:hypothetical protein
VLDIVYCHGVDLSRTGSQDLRPGDRRRDHRWAQAQAQGRGLMIAAIAIAEDLPLFTTNPDDFTGLDHLLTLVPVTRPDVPPER